jgi:hypothetical protein
VSVVTSRKKLCIPPEDGQRGPKHLAEKSINKHLKKLLRGTVLPLTLIKYAQQHAEPQNKNYNRQSGLESSSSLFANWAYSWLSLARAAAHTQTAEADKAPRFERKAY